MTGNPKRRDSGGIMTIPPKIANRLINNDSIVSAPKSAGPLLLRFISQQNFCLDEMVARSSRVSHHFESSQHFEVETKFDYTNDLTVTRYLRSSHDTGKATPVSGTNPARREPTSDRLVPHCSEPFPRMRLHFPCRPCCRGQGSAHSAL